MRGILNLKNKRAEILNYKLVSIILIMVVLISVLGYIFRADISRFVSFLPEYEVPEDEQSDVLDDVPGELAKKVEESWKEYEKNKCVLDKSFCVVENPSCSCLKPGKPLDYVRNGEKIYNVCNAGEMCLEQNICRDFEINPTNIKACMDILGDEYVRPEDCRVDSENKILNQEPCYCPKKSNNEIQRSICSGTEEYCYFDSAGCQEKELFSGEVFQKVYLVFTKGINDFAEFYWKYEENNPAVILYPNGKKCEKELMGDLDPNYIGASIMRCEGKDIRIGDYIHDKSLEVISDILKIELKKEFCENVWFFAKENSDTKKIVNFNTRSPPVNENSLCLEIFGVSLENFPED
jgi:hypothetical protein